jgi:hypothetical protein
MESSERQSKQILGENKTVKQNREVVIGQCIGERKWYLLRLPEMAS